MVVKQNRDRIKEYFAATKDILVLDTTDFKDQLTAQKMHQFNKMNKKVVIYILYFAELQDCRIPFWLQLRSKQRIRKNPLKSMVSEDFWSE